MKRLPWLLAAVVLLGCDPFAEIFGTDEAKYAPKPDTAAQDFKVCMAACARGENLSATDAATCRLECDKGASEDGDASSEVGAAVLRDYDTCARSCGDEPVASDKSTCRLQCTQSAAKHDAFASDREAQACACACLDGMLGCESACPAGADAKATCRLQCESDTTRCIDRCNAGRNG